MGHVGKTLSCMPNTTMCRDKRRCIKKSSYCDGIRDCEDNSDEKFCSAPSQIVIKGKRFIHTVKPV
jgi:hypothetical protein